MKELSIWKYDLGPKFSTTVDMPVGAKVLTIQEQFGVGRIWALVDPKAPKEKRTFKVFGTGGIVDENPGAYIGTFQMNQGSFVFHVFE